MAEYLAPGVYVEEVSFRSKSIEGVSTTTTGFVGPARYGPVTLEPDVLTSLLDFERVYGDRLQLVWKNDSYYNYLWHAVRAFFEEGGKRLYTVRVFRPLKGKNNDDLTAVYEPPAPNIQNGDAKRSAAKVYDKDGHARLWLTKETAAMSALVRACGEVFDEIAKTQKQAGYAKDRAVQAAQMAKESSEAADATKRSADEAKKSFSALNHAFETANATRQLAAGILPGTLPATLSTLLVASESALQVAAEAIEGVVRRADGVIPPVTWTAASQAANDIVTMLGNVPAGASGAAAKATAAKSAADASSIPNAVKAVFVDAETKALAVKADFDKAATKAGEVKMKAGEAKTAYETPTAELPAKAQAAETSAFELADMMDALVAKAEGALAKATEAMNQSEAATSDVRSPAAASLETAVKFTTFIREAAAAVQVLRGKASGARSRAEAANKLLVNLAAASTAAAKAFDTPDGYTNAATKADAAKTKADTDASTQQVKDAAAAAKDAVDAAKTAADAAKSAVGEVKTFVLTAKTALDQPAGNADADVQAARSKAATASAFLKALAEKAAIATLKTTQAFGLANAEADAVKNPIKDAKTAAITSEGLVTLAAASFASAAAGVDRLSDFLMRAAIEAVVNASSEAVSKLQDFDAKLRDAAKIVQDQEAQLAETIAQLAGAATDGGKPQEAVLLRARFPGAYGNLKVRLSLRLGDNLLRGTLGNAQASGLQSGDFIWIGSKTVSIDDAEAGELLLATWDEDMKAWRFGSNAEKASLVWWLNRGVNTADKQLDPETQFLRVATIAVTVISNGNDGTPEVWDGLAPHPAHTRSGSPDSLTAKFAAEPASAADARLLPIVILVDNNSINTAGALFKTLFGRLDIQLQLPHGQSRLDLDLALVGGNDGQRPGSDEYGGAEKEYGKTGLVALEDIDDISIVAAPGSTYGLNGSYEPNAMAILGLMIGHAERMRYRIAVLDSGNNQTIGQVRETCAKLDSKYAAFYYPWVKVLDPVTRKEIYLPPSGFVAGIYARNDINRGVYKAPANEVVNLALGFEITLNKSQQDVLNPLGINCFRYFPGRGYRLWGARTISSDPEWKYVNLRRYFAYLEHSVDKGTQWAVFEPNGERLWDNVRRTIYDFMLNEWQNGALLGEKPDKAFFVRCDRSTMTQNDLDNGRLVCLIGLAPLRPAEFVIFQIGQWTADHKV